MGSTWTELDLLLLPIVPRQVYCVFRKRFLKGTGDHLNTGEVLAATLDDDHRFEFPHRYRKGVLSARRGFKEMELGLPRYHPKHAHAWLMGTSTVHEERERKVRLWQQTIDELVNQLKLTLLKLREWATVALRNSNSAGAHQWANTINVLTYRPFIAWCVKISDALHRNDLPQVIHLSDMVLHRIELEGIMARVSHSIHHVKRFGEGPASLRVLLPQEDRDSFARRLDETRPLIEEFGRMCDREVDGALAPLATASKCLRDVDTDRDTLKEVVDAFFVGYDQLPPLPVF